MSENGQHNTTISPNEIYNHWYTGSENSPCNGCDRRDDNCVSQPFYGVGCPDAEVMYLGHDPGGASEIDDSSDNWYDQKRYWKNYPGTDSEINKNKAPDTFNERPFSDLPNSISELEAFVDKMENGEITGYYTNCVKCNEIRSHNENKIKDVDTLNNSGKTNCINSFLQQEIRSVIPEVIVVASNGTKHLDTMYQFFGVSDHLPSGDNVRDYVWYRSQSNITKPSDVVPTAYSKKYESVIVPAYHFSRVGGVVSDYLQDYGKDLYDSELNPPVNGGQQDWYHKILAEVVKEELPN